MRAPAYSLLASAAVLLATAVPAGDFSPFRPIPDQAPAPRANPGTPAQAALGRQLFFDSRLSFTGLVSCNSCHDLAQGGDDGRAVSIGALGITGGRSAPTLWNIGFQSAYFWDGRAASLEGAITEHLLSPAVMGMPNEATAIARVYSIAGYRQQFAALSAGPRSLAEIARALAAYLRSLVSRDSAFDRYLKGDETALSEEAREGFREFVAVGCAACHFWTNLSGPAPGPGLKMGEGFYELFPNYAGTVYDERYRLLEDPGRAAVTGDEGDRYLWRVAPLREIADTAPYFHNGSAATLDEAIRVMALTQLRVDLDARQVFTLGAFLESLTGRRPAESAPELP